MKQLLLATLAAGLAYAQTAQTTAVTVTPSATPTFTANSGNTIFRYTLGANVTTSTFASAAPGAYVFHICQPASGGTYTYTFAAFTGSTGMGTVPTGASACLDQAASWDGTTLRFVPATGPAITTGSGAPSGACTVGRLYADTVGHLSYWCDGTAWQLFMSSDPAVAGSIVSMRGSSGTPLLGIQGTTSGEIDVVAPAVAGSGTLTLPAATATLSYTVASGTATMGTSAISSAACSSTVTVTATGVASTDAITATVNGDPTAVTGYAPSASGSLYVWAWPTSGNVNFKACNNTAASITPSAITLNWRVAR